MAIPRQRIRVPQGAWTSALASLLRGNLWDGEQIAELEEQVQGYIGTADAATVPSGRAGFRFLFDSLGLEPGGEVICSAFGYPVVPFLIKGMGYELKFVDCEMHTLGMDPDKLAAAISDKTQAVVATHLYGVPCRIEEIAALCEKHNVKLVEDCAHCYGASVNGKMIGSFGDAGCFSFETSKVVNTMGGGIVTLKDAAVGTKLREYSSAEPRNRIKWLFRRLFKTTFESLVTNPILFNLGVYQMLRLASSDDDTEDRFASGYQGDEVSLAGKMGRYTNYQARLALRQLKTIGARNQKRTNNAERLISQIDGKIPVQKPYVDNDNSYSNYMLVTVLAERLQALTASLLKQGIDSKHLYMRECSGMFDGAGDFPNAVRAEKEVLHLPAFPEMSTSQVDRVGAAVARSMADLSQSAG